MSWQLLLRFFDSDHFNNDPSLAVAYLARYSNHVGIQYALCNKLRSFSYEEIEFFLPQLCHLLVSIDNDSMALEEFVIDLCQESVSGALITFWTFQTHLYDLSSKPNAASFKTCRRIFNKVQNIVFGTTGTVKAEKIHENILPTSVLASVILASVAAPFFPKHVGPLAIAQARRPRPTDETISEEPQIQSPPRNSLPNPPPAKIRRSKSAHISDSASQRASSTGQEDSGDQIALRRDQSSSKGSHKFTSAARVASLSGANGSTRMSTSSLPDLVPSIGPSRLEQPHRNNSLARSYQGDTSQVPSTSGPVSLLSREERVQVLRSNYFRSETAFLSALEGISNRLVALPKPARLSALRAELALLARDLPAEVDVPGICPATLVNGVPSQSKHHRIVRLNPAEATSLNSAERVPYLLMVEVLRNDFDFDPDSEANQRLLVSILSEKHIHKKRLFDITAAARDPIEAATLPSAPVDSVFEPALGDLSSPDLLQDFTDGTDSFVSGQNSFAAKAGPSKTPPRLSSGTNTLSSYSMLSTPRTSELPLSRATSPGLAKNSSGYKAAAPTDQPDFSALATHMRTAAQMLAQLDISSSKRPKTEVESIKAKIITSMQNLEEQSFTTEDVSSTFDSILNQTAEPLSLPDVTTDQADIESEALPEPATNTGRGAARMENDQKTGGVKRGDREDPSAATFGEDWNSKRDRIRRTSPYGWMKNWDLLSVIVKTGSDLRQELFACQLIRICAKIWEEAHTPVWLKQMRILVTSESSGLIETITNGVSLHSLKRSLTLASIAAGANPRKRIATLKDHFLKAFGEENSEPYKVAVDAFARSLAAYSILSYILQIKDRHNGNILIDNQGHMVHIDFGFMLSNSPGSVGFEAAPFKLTHEYVQVLGGVGSAGWESYRTICKQAFQALRKSAENIIQVVDLMGKESKMACFTSGAAQTTSALRQRFRLELTEKEAEAFVEADLIGKSLGSYYTRLYDTFQYRTQGIY